MLLLGSVFHLSFLGDFLTLSFKTLDDSVSAAFFVSKEAINFAKAMTIIRSHNIEEQFGT